MRISCTFLVLMVLIALTANGAEAGGNSSRNKAVVPFQPRDKWAVFIAVGHFKDISAGNLKFPGENVDRLIRAFTGTTAGRFQPDHVSILVDAGATKSQVEDTLTRSWLVRKALPNDLVVLYFCGKAMLASDGKDISFVAYDTPQALADSSGLSLKNLLVDIQKRTQSHNIICLLDLTPILTSQAGNRISADGNTVLQQIASDARVTIFAADRMKLLGDDNTVNENSLFARYLAEGIETANGLVPLDAIIQRVCQNVTVESQKLFASPQIPQFVANPDFGNIATTLVPGLPAKPNRLNDTSNVRFGHPLDTIAIDRPDLFMPRVSGGQPAFMDISVPGRNGEDADNNGSTGADVDFASYMAKMKRDIQSKWQPPEGLEERKIVTTFLIMS